MTNNRPRLRLGTISVEGLNAACSVQAKQEIRTLLAPLESFELKLAVDLDVSVIVTDRMEQRVDETRRDQGMFVEPYTRVKAHGVSAGIALIEPSSPPVRACLVMDHGLWALQDVAAVVNRVFMLGHMLGYAVLAARRGMARDSERECDGGVHQAALRDFARMLIDTYEADQTAIALCKSVQLDGVPAAFSKYLGPDAIDAVHDYAEELCVFAAIDVQFYRVTGVGLADLYPRVAPLLAQALLQSVRAMTVYLEDKNDPGVLNALQASPGFRAYIQPEFPSLLAALVQDDAAKAESLLGGVFERVLGLLGLHVEDSEGGGLHVHVSEPVVCPVPAADGAA